MSMKSVIDLEWVVENDEVGAVQALNIGLGCPGTAPPPTTPGCSGGNPAMPSCDVPFSVEDLS